MAPIFSCGQASLILLSAPRWQAALQRNPGSLAWVDADNVGDFCGLHREYLDRRKEHAGIIVVPRQRYDVKQQIRLLRT